MASFTGDGKFILTVFIGAIIAVVFLASFADDIFTQTNSFTLQNSTVTSPAVNGTLDLTGRELTSVPAINIYNTTNTSNQVGNGINIVTATSATTGLRTVQLVVNDTGAAYAGSSQDISYTYLPDGYSNNSGARNVILLIPIFAALAIVIFVIVVMIKEGSFKKIVGWSK